MEIYWRAIGVARDQGKKFFPLFDTINDEKVDHSMLRGGKALYLHKLDQMD